MTRSDAADGNRGAAVAGTPAPRRALAVVWARRETLFWAALVIAVILIQWPMLKGWYYKSTGAEAPPSAIVWRTDFDAALAEARVTNKRVLVDFSADWCPPCVAMKHDVWPHHQVAAAVNGGYVPLLVDADRDTVLAARFRVSAIPTVLMLDAGGNLVKRNDGYLPRSGMLRFLAGTAE
jgi:thiol:disulfide interchange protein